MGERDYSIRAWLDPQKLASLSMTAVRRGHAVRDQNKEAAPGQLGQPPMSAGQAAQLPLHTLGRLSDSQQFETSSSRSALLRKSPRGGVRPLGGDSARSMPRLPSKQHAPRQHSGRLTTDLGLGDWRRRHDDGRRHDRRGATSGGGGTTGRRRDLRRRRHDRWRRDLRRRRHDPRRHDRRRDLRRVPKAKAGDQKNRGSRPSKPPPPPSTSIVRLRDVAPRRNGRAQITTCLCIFDGKPRSASASYQLPGTNAPGRRTTASGAKMEELKKRFPDGMSYTIAYDITPFIRESVDEVFYTLRDAVLLVALVFWCSCRTGEP